jgi:type VI secretion system ImpH/TssG family protein
MSGELFDRLRTRARDFEFAQWIRLWLREKIQSDHRGGDALQRLDDGLDVHHSGSLGFAPQDIDAAGASPEGEEELRVHFMGLQGASSPLPAYLVDPLQRSDERWNPLREFYRLFEGRVYRVLGAGLIERSPVLRAELGAADPLGRHLREWTGGRDAAGSGMRSGGLAQLVPRSRSRKGLERFLSRQLGTDRVQVDDRSVAWVPNPSPASLDGCLLDGSSATGDSIPVQGEKVSISLGPVGWESYRAGVADPEALRRKMSELMTAFLPRPMEWEAEIVLDPSTIPAGAGRGLGDGEAQAVLGAAGWLGEADAEPGRMALG